MVITKRILNAFPLLLFVIMIIWSILDFVELKRNLNGKDTVYTVGRVIEFGSCRGFCIDYEFKIPAEKKRIGRLYKLCKGAKKNKKYLVLYNKHNPKFNYLECNVPLETGVLTNFLRKE